MDIEIVNYHSMYKQYFYDYNIEWLNTYFVVEPFDEKVLSNPEDYIIDKGGYIFFAKKDDKILGTVALMPLDKPNLFELTKMAVNKDNRGLKIGQKLLEHCIAFAKSKGLPKLMLYSSTKLKNAIYIYKKYGFKEIPLEDSSKYKRSDIKMELIFN